MKTKWCAGAIAGVLCLTTVLPLTVEAGRGRGGSGGGQWGNTAQVQTQQRLRDGSCINPAGPQDGSGFKNKRGNVYGPGDGTGYKGAGPKDGTGYGAPASR